MTPTQQLRSRECPACSAAKASGQCFCKRCYFALPVPLRNSLWLKRADAAALDEWKENYAGALAYLARLGLGKNAGKVTEEAAQ
jgi:hypothetical protein